MDSIEKPLFIDDKLCWLQCGVYSEILAGSGAVAHEYMESIKLLMRSIKPSISM